MTEVWLDWERDREERGRRIERERRELRREWGVKIEERKCKGTRKSIGFLY